MSGKPLRVGVIGVGGIAQMMHLPTLAERPDLFEIVALADVSAPALAAVGARYGVRALHEDGRELIARTDLDAVIVASSGSHREAVTLALQSGKHVFVEKPLGFGPKETAEIARLRKERGMVLMVGYHKRYDPAYRRAREAVRAMRDCRYVEVTVLHPDDGDYRAHHAILPVAAGPRKPVPESVDQQGAIKKVTTAPYAALMDAVLGAGTPVDRRVAASICCESLLHDINAVRGILGEPEEVVSSHVWRGGFAQSSLTRFGGDVRVNMSWILVPGLRNYEETVRFVGPDCRVTLVFPSPYLRHLPTPLTIEKMEGETHVVEHHTVSYEEAFRVELHELHAHVAKGTIPETSAEDALGDARWIEALVGAYDGAPRAVAR